MERGLSITQLSKISGIDKDVLRREENGKTKLKKKTQLKLIEILKTVYLDNCT
ncbi:MAG: putative transcriptional regulator [Planctomycetota bacterium]